MACLDSENSPKSEETKNSNRLLNYYQQQENEITV